MIIWRHVRVLLIVVFLPSLATLGVLAIWGPLSQAVDDHTISVTAGPGGSISLGNTVITATTGSVSVNDGATPAFTITPATGYSVSQVSIDSASVPLTGNQNLVANGDGSYTYTFAAVTDDDQTISATFTINSYTISVTAGPGGSISLGNTVITATTGSVSVNDGATPAFTITPATGYSVSQVSIDSASVPLTGNQNLVANGDGSYTYTFAAVTDDDQTISATFTINSYTISVTAGPGGSISLGNTVITATTGSVSVNDGATPAFTITPATGYSVSQVSIDSASVPLTGNQNLVANGDGSYTYTFAAVTDDDQTISATFTINSYTISASAPGGNGTITVTPSSGSVAYGAPASCTITPATGYSLSKLTDNGTDVTASVSNTSYTIASVTTNHTLVATFTINSYTISASAPGGNGTITVTPSSGSVAYGAPASCTITPATGYSLSKLTDNGTDVTASVSNTSYTIASVTTNHTLVATFTINSYTISASAPGGNGTITVTPSSGSVAYGAPASCTITPATGYSLSKLTDNGTDVTASVSNTSYTIASVITNHTLVATFTINTFTVTPSAGANGSISPAATQTVAYGAPASCTITPATGYSLSKLTDNGTDVTASVSNTSYTIASVTTNHTLVATFTINTFTVTPSVGANGSISPAATQTVAYGDKPTFTITPATGYYVADVLVDGTSVGPVTSYTFPAVSAKHTISASFAVGVQTRLSISAAKTVVDYGSSTLLTGVLYNSSDPRHEVGMGAQPVTLQSASSPAGPWVDLNTLTTSSVAVSLGSCMTTVRPTSSTYYRLRFAVDVDSMYGGSLSFVVQVAVRPKLGMPQVPASVGVGRTFTVFGTLSPRFPVGQKTVAIQIYRYRNRRWVPASHASAINARSGDNTRYAVKIKLTTKGQYRFQASTVPSASWADAMTGLSSVLTVR